MSASGDAVLVTGASGFVGSHVARRLAGSGADVTALARESSDRSPLADVELDWRVGDLLDGDSIDRAVAGFVERARDTGRRPLAVHSAAQLGYSTDGGELARRVNVEGTRLVLDACQRHGVERVCFVSSVVAVGFTRDSRAELDEEAPFTGSELRCHYVTTKRAAEDFALAVSRQLDVVVVNPGAVFGPAPRRTNTAEFVIRVADGRVPPLSPPGSLAVVGVHDVADGIERALARGERGRRYLLVESNLRLAELLARVGERLGVAPPVATAPRPVWRLVEAGLALADRFRRLEVLTPAAARHLGVHYRFSAARARSELGWEPAPFDDVLDETVAWLRSVGAIPVGGTESGGNPNPPARARAN